MARHRAQIPWLTFFSEPLSKVSLIVCLHLEHTVITTPSKPIRAYAAVCNSLAEEAPSGPFHPWSPGGRRLDDGGLASICAFILKACGLEGCTAILALREKGLSGAR